MKKLKLMALGLLGVSMFTFTSCAEDEDTEAPSPNLTVTASTASITGAANESITISSGTTVDFAISAQSVGGTDLKSIQLIITGVNATTNLPESVGGYDYSSSAVVDLDNADEDVYSDILSVDGIYFGTEGKTTYRFILTDNNNKSTARDIEVNVTNPEPLNTEVTGAFFHIGGSLQGAYDLVDNKLISGSGASADPTKQDMKNTDAAGNIFTGSWTAANATLFVKSNGFDYANATVSSAAAAYADGTPGSNVGNPINGDIYIAKLRGTGDFAVIKIVSVDPTDNTCACGNRGKITFDFKKK